MKRPGLRLKHVIDKMLDLDWRSPIPTLEGLKAPAINGWQEFNRRAVTRLEADRWKLQYPDCGVGLAVGVAPAIALDIDILDALRAAQAEGLAVEIFGKTPLRRVGLPPKVLLVYQRDPYLVISGKQFGGTEWFLRSGQFICEGVHPDTGLPYEWTTGERPATLRPTDLPLITPDQINQFMAEMASRGLRTKSNSPNARIDMLACLTPQTKPGKDSSRIMTGGRAFDLSNADASYVGGNGDAAIVLPLLRKSEDPLQKAAEILEAAGPGERHPTMVGCVHALIEMGFSDDDVLQLGRVYARKFMPGEERETRSYVFCNAVEWSRKRVGVCADEAAAALNLEQMQERWLARRRSRGGR